LIVVVVLFLTGGKSGARTVLNAAKKTASGLVANLTTQAAASMMKKDS